LSIFDNSVVINFCVVTHAIARTIHGIGGGTS